MYLRVNRFGGLQPLVDSQKLPDHRAQTATATRFESGNLRTYAAGVQVSGISQPAVFTQDARSLYYVAPGRFFVWQGAVNAVPGPMPAKDGTGDFRIIFAGDTGATPVWPRWTTRDRGCVTATWRDAPSAGGVFPLGVPKPADVPTITTSAPPTGTITGATNTDPIALTITGGAVLETGHRIKITGAPSSGDGSELNGVVYSITKDTDSIIRLSAADGTGWTAALTGLAWTWTREFSDVDNEQRAYCYTLVRVIDGIEEEGPPSTPSAVVSIPPDATVNIATSTAASRPYGSIGGLTTVIAKKRIYRSVAGSQVALFQFVAERDINEASYSDDLEFSELGEVLPTEDFDLPPQNLAILAELPNGVLVGAFDNVLCASEPYQPSFWPTKYRRTMNHPIVGAAVYGNTIVVATTAKPVVVVGTDPASWSDVQLDQVYPALDRMAVCSSGSSVFFVSTVGIVQVDDSGARVITAAYWTPEQWKALVGTAVTTGYMHLAWWSNRLVLR
ncbi:MAG: Sinorhizobium phage [Pseudomonadota bacterium]